MKHYIGLSLVLAVAVALLLVVMQHCEHVASRAAVNVSRAFIEALHVQPEIRINQTILTTQTAPIAELAIVSKEQLVTYALNEKIQLFNRTVPFTGKSITAQAAYRIKAGYDLTEPFRVNIDSRSGRVTAQLPAAKLLSVERIGELSLQDNDQWLNRITPEERQKVLNELDALARHGAESSGLVADAEKQAMERLEELAGRNGQKLIISKLENLK